jgi:hypothetical protein
VDDFVVARIDARANPAFAFDDGHLSPGPGERSRNGKTDNSRADNETLDRFHPSAFCSNRTVLAAYTSDV